MPGYRSVVERYFEAVTALGMRVLRLLALSLGLPAEHFHPSFSRPMLALRPLRYRCAVLCTLCSWLGSLSWRWHAGVEHIREERLGGRRRGPRPHKQFWNYKQQLPANSNSHLEGLSRSICESHSLLNCQRGSLYGVITTQLLPPICSPSVSKPEEGAFASGAHTDCEDPVLAPLSVGF